MQRARALAAASSLGVGLLALACRDVAEVFESTDRPPRDETLTMQITFSPYDDRGPNWNATSDTIFYSGHSADLSPNAESTILSIPLRGDGLARTALRNVQAGRDSLRWLVTPAASPDAAERVAYVRLLPLASPLACEGAADSDCLVSPSERPRLFGAWVYVRERAAVSPVEDDPELFLDMNAVEVDTAFHVPGMPSTIARYYPYQWDYHEGRTYPFRPSWSADGERLVVSDGRRLLVWRPATGTLDTIPGAEDATSPAWSPDGERIAYVWSEPIDSVSERCAFGNRGPFDDHVTDVRCYERRIRYITAPARVVVIRPDGSDREVVAEGRDPAWAPDGTLLIAGEDVDFPPELLRRYDPATGEIVEIDGTLGAREPSVSPDGTWVAFSRSELRFGPRDIFVARLD